VCSSDLCIILLGNNIHRVENIESKKLTPFFDKAYIPVPASAEKKYIQTFILKTIPKYEVKIEGIDMTELFPARQATLILEEDFHQQMTFFLYFRYNDHKINPAQRKIKFVELVEIDGAETICWFMRDLDWEKLLINKLLTMGLRLEGDNRFYLQQNPEILQRYGLIGWLNENRQNLSDFTIEQHVGANYYMGTIALQSNINLKIDWFDIEILVVFDDFTIPFSRFRKHLLNGNIEYILPDKTIFILPEVWFHRYVDLFVHGTETDHGVRIHKMHIGLLNEWVSELFSEKKKQELQKIRQLPDERPVVPLHLNDILRPYQKEGFYWLVHLYNHGLGGCLSDDMGLGKTLQTIAFLDFIYATAGKKETQGPFSLFSIWESMLPATLIIVPKSLLHNWQKELKKFAPGLKVFVYAGNKRIKTMAVIKKIAEWPL
jgi:hypothetical protein